MGESILQSFVFLFNLSLCVWVASPRRTLTLASDRTRLQQTLMSEYSVTFAMAHPDGSSGTVTLKVSPDWAPIGAKYAMRSVMVPHSLARPPIII